jgi:hypothetical protein
MKKNSVTVLLASVFVFVYLIVDIFHFFIYRIKPVYPTFTEAFYESIIVSLVKWAFCIIILVGYFLDKRNKSLSFYLFFVSAIGITLLYVLKGQLMYMLRGSVVFKIGLLELASILIFIYSIFTLIKKYKIKWLSVLLSLIIAIVIFGLLFYQLPVYHKPYY